MKVSRRSTRAVGARSAIICRRACRFVGRRRGVAPLGPPPACFGGAADGTTTGRILIT